jgi:mitogen-activated protein kinase organizer 1
MGQLTTDVLGYPITSITRTRDGNACLVSLLRSKAVLVDLTTGGVLRTFKGGGFSNKGLRLRSTLAANEGVVVCGSEGNGDAEGGNGSGEQGGRIFAFDVLTGEVVVKLRHGEGMGKDGVVGCVAWTDRKGKGSGWWASGGSDGVVKVWGEREKG